MFLVNKYIPPATAAKIPTKGSATVLKAPKPTAAPPALAPAPAVAIPALVTKGVSLLNKVTPFPTVDKTGPIAIATIPIFKISSCVSGDKSLNLSARFPMPSATSFIAGATIFNIFIDAVSNAPPACSIVALVLSCIVSAISLAAPSQFLNCSVKSVKPSFPPCIKTVIPDKASVPKIVAIVFCFCSSVRFFVFSFNSPIIVASDFIFPLESKAVNPIRSIAVAAGSDGFANLTKADLSVVPAWLPLIPALASSPIAAVTSSKLRPAARAFGAIYFIASPVSATAALVAAAFLAKTSATCPVLLASKPKPLSVLAAISELVAKSSPELAAKSKSPGIASMISFVEKPALAKFSIPSATSLALKAVLCPNDNAWSSNILN